MFDTRGRLFHASRPGAWEGRPLGDPKLEQGDVVVRLPPPPLPLGHAAHAVCAAQGMLLDCDADTLTVWLNGERKGVMVRPGMTDRHGDPVGRLEGPLRWAVDLAGAAVAIAGPLPPPA